MSKRPDNYAENEWFKRHERRALRQIHAGQNYRGLRLNRPWKKAR